MARSRRDRDDDDDDDRPAKRRSSRRDDDDEDEKPAKRRASRDDDDDDRPAKKKPASRNDDDDDDDEEDERPSKRKVVSRDDDEDEEDEKPVKKKSRAKDDDEDEDDDYDDRPKKRGKKTAKKSNMGLIIGLAAGGGLLAVGLVVGLIFLLPMFMESPKSAIEDIQNSAEKKDYGRLYDRLDEKGQEQISAFMELAKMSPDMAPHKDKKGRDLFVAVMEVGEKKNPGKNSGGPFGEVGKKATVESVDQNGDDATVTIRTSDGKIEKVKMVKQKGTWRLSSAGQGGPFGK